MNTKTLTRILTIILMTIVLLIQLNGVVMAAKEEDKTGLGKDEIKSMISGANGSGLETAAESIGGVILGTIRIVGNFVAVGFLIWLGIKWVMASAQDKADLKKNMWFYVIGIFLIFGAANIIPWIVEMATNIGGQV